MLCRRTRALLSCCLMLATRMDRAWCVDRINRAFETLYRHRYVHAVIPWRGVADVCRQCVRMREKDWCFRARVALARSPWRARVACVPRMRQRQLFSRTLWPQKRKSKNNQPQQTHCSVSDYSKHTNRQLNLNCHCSTHDGSQPSSHYTYSTLHQWPFFNSPHCLHVYLDRRGNSGDATASYAASVCTAFTAAAALLDTIVSATCARRRFFVLAFMAPMAVVTTVKEVVSN